MIRTMKDIVRRTEKTVARILDRGGIRSLLVAVSGGADSVALLCICHRLSKRFSLRIEAVNCNFHLRGEESDRDSAFVARLCDTLGIPLQRLDYDVDEYIKLHPGCSLETACRELRYADFFRLCHELSLDRVAVAHNADDDVETMMLNMLRGSGSRGLKGMDSDNGRVIRPLLGVTRKEIEEFLLEIGQDHITDSSNLTSEFRRNFLRREVVPLLAEHWSGARKSLSRTVAIMKEESEIVEAHYRRQLVELTEDDGKSLRVYHPGVTRGTVLRFLEPFGGNAEVAEEIIEACRKTYQNRRWRLSDRYDALLERDRLIVKDIRVGSEPRFLWQRLEMTDALMREVKGNRSHDVAYLAGTPSMYEIRRPITGDRMSPIGMMGTRLVSDIISDAKLDNASKENVRLLVRKADGEIIWVSGLKRSRHALVTPKMPEIYKLSVAPDC